MGSERSPFSMRAWKSWGPASVAILAAFVGLRAEAQTEMYRFVGGAANQRLGRAVANVLDVNNDGAVDFAGGAPDTNTVQVFSGLDDSILWTFAGPGSSSFGCAIAGLGDVNFDGYGDVAVGAFGDDIQGRDAGRVTVFSGFDGAVVYEILGPTSGAWFGYSVANAGDVNLDGVDDLIVGIPNVSVGGGGGGGGGGRGTGTAEIYSGSTGTLIRALLDSGTSQLLGWSVAPAGFVDGDAYPDVIVGAPASRSAIVFSGRNGAVLYRFAGASADRDFGFSVSAIGDTDGDSAPDFAVGAPTALVGDVQRGFVRVFRGPGYSLVSTIRSGITGDRFGASVAGLQDADGDGLPDFAAGAPNGGSAGSGRVDVFSGAFSGIAYPILNTVAGDSSGDGFGTSVASAGDPNGDGLGDMILGWPFDDKNGTNSGTVSVYSIRRVLFLLASVPSPADTTLTIRIAGADPAQSAVGLFYGFREGSTKLDGCQEGVNLGMSPVKGMILVSTDAGGSRTLVRGIPSSVRGRLALLQLGDLQTCETGNLVRRVFPR